MSIGDLINGARAVNGAVQGIGSTVSGISNSVKGLTDALGLTEKNSFWSQLKPASYRGVKFAVLGGTARFGRRNAVHEYPFRDTPWIEDIGRAARRILVTGFIHGDDVIAQRDRLIEACEKPGDGELVHPTLGRRTVALMDVSTTEHSEQGRVFEISFSFIEQGQRLYPGGTTASTAAVTAAAKNLNKAGALAFIGKAAAALQSGAAVALSAIETASRWANTALQVANDAISLVNLVTSLPGQFGRVFGLVRGLGSIRLLGGGSSDVSVQDLIAKAAVSRQNIGLAVDTLTAAGANLTASTASEFASAAQGVAASVLAAAPTPGDGLRGLLSMAAFTPAPSAGSVSLVLQGASVDLFRRAALAAAAEAAAAYQPASGDDAAAVRAEVLAAMDDEITRAGDQADDDVYAALRALRAATVQGLNEKGAALPTLTTVHIPLPMPSLVLAQRLYRDPTRSDELVSRANPIHPAFMPTTFSALNT